MAAQPRSQPPLVEGPPREPGFVPPHSYLRDAWWRCVPGALLCGWPVVFCGLQPTLNLVLFLNVLLFLLGIAFFTALCDLVDGLVLLRQWVVVKWGLANVVLSLLGLVHLLVRFA